MMHRPLPEVRQKHRKWQQLFPTLRTVGEGTIEASSPDGGNTMWYNSAFYDEPDAPHTIIQSANGVDWYAMQQHAEAPEFEPGE